VRPSARILFLVTVHSIGTSIRLGANSNWSLTTMGSVAVFVDNVILLCLKALTSPP